MDPVCIHRAAKEGYLHMVRQLIEAGVSVNVCDDKGRTPLLLAAEWGHHAVVEFLINCNCELDPEYLMLLDTDMEYENAIGVFYQHGSEVICPDEENYTLLHFASRNGWADIARTIIEKGSESDMVNAATGDGITPLMLAATRGHEDVAALLLQSGADVNRKDIQGFPALHGIAFEGHVRILKLLLQAEGLDLIPQDIGGQTPLHLACFWGDHEEVIKQLLVAGADTNFSNTNGETPLSIYLKLINPSLEVINLFIQRGAFFQGRDGRKISANPVLRHKVLKNVDLCTQSVINKFSHQTLPVLYSCPYFANQLPSMENLKLNTSQKDEVKNFVRCDIQQNKFCNVVRVRPTALSALCIQCLAAYITDHK